MNETNERARLQPATGLAKVSALPPRRTTTTPVQTQPATDAPAASIPASRTSHGGTRSISFTTPVLVRDLLRTTARASERTVAEVVLGAVSDSRERLGDLVAAERPTSPSTFVLFPDPAAAPARSSEPRVTVTLRTTAANIQVLDDLVVSHRADDRSQLITAALRAALTPAT
jgi:hypothetical protein